MGRPDGGEGAKTTRSFDVADDTDGDQRRCFNDCDGLDDLAFVHLYKWCEEGGVL